MAEIVHPSDGPSVVAASPSYRVVSPAPGRQEVRAGDKVLATGSWAASALWGNTLWTAGKDSQGSTVYERFSPPSMRRLESPGGRLLPPVRTAGGGPVRLLVLRAERRRERSDQNTGLQQDVPRGYARLGDGYAVSQDDDAGKLLITYLRDTVPADRVSTQELGPLPSPAFAPADRRGRFWNVDPFGGPVVYQTASGDVTVKWPQGTLSPFAAVAAAVPTSVDLRQGGNFQGVWHLNRPAESWKLTVTAPGGAVVRSLTAGLARGRLTATWDGRAENGTLVRTGTYRVELTARAANGSTTDTVLYDKKVPVRSVERHDFGRDSIGDLITFDSAWKLAIQPGTGAAPSTARARSRPAAGPPRRPSCRSAT